MRRSLLAVLLLALTGCTGPQALICHGTQRSAAVAELLFGRNIGGHLGVSEAAWRPFLAREVTPRFPDGLTVVDASGQWRDPARGTIVREPSKIVTIVLPDSADNHARLEAIVEAYKRRFRQQSVGLMVRPACVTF
jgi:hypothetical protein